MSTNLERLDRNEFAPVSTEEAELVLGGLAEAAVAAGTFRYTGEKTIILNGVPTTLEEWESDPNAE